MYAKRDGVPQNYSIEVSWLKRAAFLGNSAAAERLGELYLRDDVVEKDTGSAVEWFIRAAESGNADAQLSLASMYENGDGVPVDLVRAHMWLNIAASRAPPCPKDPPDPFCDYATAGRPSGAAAHRDELATKMTKQQIA
jgi:hypothetical protein